MAPPKKTRSLLVSHPSASHNSAKDSPGWALKKTDGEMFTREDIQYGLMSAIFNDRTFLFTSPLDGRAVSFRELYIETLSKFSKAAKSTLKLLDENPVWATNFCIASFLINIGRINTTVAFYPELRAYMRTYHPVPCLQKDDYSKVNLQDAPRIKTMLKSCQLPSEFNSEPVSLPDIAHRSAQGYRPPTTVVNLIFELFNVEPYVSAKYFPDGFVLHDLFSPTTIPTKLRAYAFLWLMHHFLEDPSAVADFEVEAKVQGFQLAKMEDIQPSSLIGDTNSNVDSEEEIRWGKEMQAYRLEFKKKSRGREGDESSGAGLAPVGDDGASQSNLPPHSSLSQIATGSNLSRQELPPGSGRPDLGTNFKPKTLTKTRITHVERIQSALHAMAKYGDDSDLEAPDGNMTSLQLAWRRNQHDTELDRDVAYDSDDPHGPLVVPEWKPKELKYRLLGFAFPVQSTEVMDESERKDKVIRYVGAKKSANRINQARNNSHKKSGSGSGPPGHSFLVSPNIMTNNNPTVGDAGIVGATTTTKVKRKRKAAAAATQGAPPSSSMLPSFGTNAEVDPSWHSPNYHLSRQAAVPVE